MGRRPNVVIQEYFHRGPKLTDNSNRYPQTCKLCGDEFPKGRFDSLTNHLTKRCARITQTQRINACLALNGINASRTPKTPQSRQQHQQQSLHSQQQFPQHHTQMPYAVSQLQSPQGWALTPLETLAEVSRQQITHLNEHGEDCEQAQHAMADADLIAGLAAAAGSGDQYHPHDQFVVNSPESAPRRVQVEEEATKQDDMDMVHQSAGAEQSHTLEASTAVSDEAPDLTVAAAAAARLRSESALDTALYSNLTSNIAASLADTLGKQHADGVGSVGQAQESGAKPIHGTPRPASSHALAPSPPSNREGPDSGARSPSPMTPSDLANLANADRVGVAIIPGDARRLLEDTRQPAAGGNTQLPWGQFSYMTTIPAPPKPALRQQMEGMPTRSVFRLDQNGAKGRHSRARFTDSRRKEVQNIRKIGACIRCRILRKTCSQGDPCETCRKVLTPRIWNTGCIRTKFTDKLDLYGARIQFHHALRAVEAIEQTKDTLAPGIILEATHSDHGITLVFDALRAVSPGEQIDPVPDRSEDYESGYPKVVMAASSAVLPELMHSYLEKILPELVQKEEASFSRITLEMSLQNLATTGNRVLKLALDLWGYVEIIERELKWKYQVQASPAVRGKLGPITRETDPELFRTLGFQMSAAAELKAEITSKNLLLHMGRDLQDGRTTIGKPMFCAILLLLISVEKSTWAFLTWERVPQLKELWPLPTQPGEYTKQGDQLAELLRMLLTIRKALPMTSVRGEDDVLTTDDPDYHAYFEQINLKASDVLDRRLHPPFFAATSRSLELRYCSTILLPEHLLPPQEAAEVPIEDAERVVATAEEGQGGPQAEPLMAIASHTQDGADVASGPSSPQAPTT